MVLMIDNFDSFTYNIVQYVGDLGHNIRVYRNNELTPDGIDELEPKSIIISPGPCTPKEAGVSVELIQKLYKKYPILGICLGHQSIGAAFGAEIIRAPYLMHGKISKIYHNKAGIFKNIPNPFIATRYHSLIIDTQTLPKELEITANTEDDIIMAIKHRVYPIFGLQFHPESIMTEQGKKIIENFLNL